MLALDRHDAPLPADLLDAPGGFLWWYADVIDMNGNGLVCIWSWGLPFLPGRAAAWRAGNPQSPRSRPSLNLAVYANHRAIAYHLLELAPEDATWDGDAWRFGDSRFELDRTRGELTAHLHLPIPGGVAPLTGGFTLRGRPARWPAPPEPASNAHRWAPLLGPCDAEVDLRAGDTTLLRARGVGYHDRNGSPAALDALGLDHWLWGRCAIDGRTALFYLSFPTDPEAPPCLIVATGDADGAFTFREASCELRRRRLARFGMPWWREIIVHGLDAPLVVEVAPPVDDGPFYLRSMLRATLGDGSGPGFVELCRPDRVDHPALRPLVAMAVQRSGAAGSCWLPLFCGPRADRLTRLARWWRARASS